MNTQMPKSTILLLASIMILFVYEIKSDEQSKTEVFVIHKLELQPISYPWGDELYLSVQGIAHPICANATLTFSLFYTRQPIKWFNVVVAKPSESSVWLPFEQTWGPLNGATQELLPGNYNVMGQLLLNKQSRAFREKWEQQFPGQHSTTFNKEISLGRMEDFLQRSEKEKEFYVGCMRTLNDLFRELFLKKQKIVQSQNNQQRPWKSKKAPPEKTDRKAAIESLKMWLSEEFSTKIMTEQKLLQRRRQQLFILRYPVTHNSMETYASILSRMGQRCTEQLKGNFSASKSKDSMGFDEDIAALLECIQELHAKSAVEMKISLREKLGYLPPPSIR